MPENKENLINREGFISGMPITPLMPGPGLDERGNPTPNMSVAETWEQALSKAQSGGVPSIPLSSFHIGERYDKTRPGTDFEEAHAQQQHWTEKMAHGIGKMGVLAGTTFVQGTVGMVNGLVEWSKTGKQSSFYDNDLNRQMDEINKTFEDKWANYYTAAEKDASWYSPKKLFSANFLFDGIVKNLGFSLGVIASGAVYGAGLAKLTQVLSNVPKIGRLVSIGKAGEILTAQETALLGSTAAGRSAATTAEITSLYKKFISQYKNLTTAQRVAVAGLATSGEASFEAYHNMNEFRQRKINEFREQNGGMDPSTEDLAEINEQASKVGNWSYLFNVAILSATNYIQFPKIFGSSYKVDKTLAASATRPIGKIVREGDKFVAPAVKGNRLIRGIKGIAPYTFSATEAFEEGAQYAVTVGVQDFYDKKYNNLPTDFMGSVMEGIAGTLGTDIGMENVLIGGLSGALMLGYGKYRQATEKRDNTAAALESEKRWTGQAGINTAGFSQFTKDTFDSVARGAQLQQERLEAIENGDILKSKDLEADYIINYLIPRIKYGRFDLVKADIEEYKMLASTEEGFIELQKSQIASEADTRGAFLKRLMLLEATANNTATVYENLQLRFGSAVDEKGNRVYDDQIIDKMVYATAKIADYDTRIRDLSARLAASVPNLYTILEDTAKGDPKSFNDAVANIDSLDIIDSQKEELAEALEDMVELSLLRTVFLKEFHNIKVNPSKYKEAVTTEKIAEEPEVPEVPEVKTVKVKTKIGDKEIEIGTKYYVGRTVKYNEKGERTTRPIALTILKDNGDGTLQIQDHNGKIRNIEASVLEDYRLGKASVAQNNPVVSFYMRNWDNKVERKLKGGARQTGWLEHDPDTNQLFFVHSITRKGKQALEKIPITLSLFEKKLGYSEGVYAFRGPLTKEDIQDIENNKKELTKPEQAKIYALNTIEGNRAVIADLYEKFKESQKRINELILSKRADIEDYQRDLEALEKKIETAKEDKRAKKGMRLVPTARKALRQAMDLSRAKVQIEEEIAALEDELADVESTLSYLEDSSSNINEVAEITSDIIKSLKDDIDNIEKKLIPNTAKQIGVLTKFRDQLEETVDKFMKYISSIIDSFFKDYPLLPKPLVEDEVDWKGFYEKIQRPLVLTPGTRRELKKLEMVVKSIEEDGEVKVSQETIRELNDQLGILQTTLNDLSREIEAKTVMLKAFEEAYKNYREAKIEEGIIKDAAKLIEDAVGTADNGNIHTKNPTDDDAYEPAAKKSAAYIWRATMGIYQENVPHLVRANRFGFNLNKFSNRKSIKGVYVTSDNEHLIIPGLMNFIDQNKQDEIDLSQVIALVMVDDSTGMPRLVGEDGKILTEEQLKNPFDHIIFQTMPLAKLQWASGESMFRNNEKSLAAQITEDYGNYRSGIFDQAKAQNSLEDVPLHPIQASFGHPRIEKIDGKINYDVRTSVVDASLIEESEMFDREVIFIPTLTDIVEEQTTRYEGNNIGRIFLRMRNAVLPLQNRKHTKEEAETIFKVLLQLSRNIIDKNIGPKHPDSIRLYEWLETVVYWGIPTTPEGKRKSDSYNSVFWEKNSKGEFVLVLSGKGTNFRFTPSALAENKEAIVGMLEQMYMNVKNSTLKNVNEPYGEIVDIDANGKPVYREWKNYQSFLLSDKVVTFDKSHEDNGKKRSNVPVTTVISPVADEKDMNRTGIYFYTTDNPNEIDVPEIKETPKLKVQPDKPSTAKPGETKVTKPSGKTKYVYDGVTENTVTNAEGKTIVFTIDSEGNLKILPKGDILDIVTAKMQEVEKKWKDEGKISDEVFRVGQDEAIKEAAKDAVKNSVRRRIEQDEAAYQGTKPTPKAEEQPKPAEPAKPAKPAEEVDDSNVDQNTLNSVKTLRESLRNKKHDNDENKLFRLANQRASEKFEKEDWPKVEAWLRANFPGLPVYRVKNIIQATNGQLAWGMFKNAALYIYEAAEEGTTYHEVFEAVWKMFTTASEQAQIAAEFRSRTGEFMDRETGKKIKYSDASAHQLKEQLAEEFRGYVLNNKIPPKPAKGRPLIVQLFYDIVNFIKKAFFGKGTITIEEMFKNISTGQYKNRVPYGQLSLANKGIIDINEARGNEAAQFREVPGIPGNKVSQIVDSMIYYTIFGLIRDNQSLFNLTDKKTRKDELYVHLENQIIENIILQSNTDAEGATETEAERIYEKADVFAATVITQWDNIVKQFEDRITAYDIQFDENDIVNVNEYQKSKEDAFIEGNKVDHFKRASGAVKLLLATMIQMDSQGNPMRSSVGGPILIPMSKTVVNLYNRLHSSRTPEEMLYRLREMAMNDPNYRGLYRRLTNRDYSTPIMKDGSNILLPLSDMFDSQHSLRLISSFYSTFRKQNPEVLTVTIFENGDVAVGNTNLSTAATQLRDDYINALLAKAKSGGEYLVYDKKQKAYVGNGVKIKQKQLTTLESMIKFLEDIGIEFDIKAIRNLESRQPRLYKEFKESVNGIRKSIAENEKIVTVSGRTLSMNKRLLTLGYVQASINHPEFDSTFFSINGERTQSFIGTNPASDLYDFLNSLEEFTAEQLAGTQYEYLINDSFAKGSSIIARMFNENGKRKEVNRDEDLMRVVYVSGTDNIATGKQKQSSKLTYRERLAQEVNLNLHGYYLNLVPGDASMEWGLYMGNPVTEKNIRSGNSIGHAIFRDYFISEVNMMKEDRWVHDSRNNKELRFFKSILGEELHNKILKDKDFNTKSAEEVYDKYKSSIQSAINKQLTKDNRDLQANLERYNLLIPAKDAKSQFVNIDIPGELSDAELEDKLTYLNINFMIANIEMHKLIYSDPYQYSDELKRIKNFNSPRQSLISNSSEMNSALHKVWNSNFQEGDPGYYDFHKDYFITAVHEDVMSIVSDMAKYMEGYEETDGGGIITFPAYRNLRIRSSNWNEREESQYIHDMTYERMKREGATKEELAELNKFNPKVRSAYTPIKPIVSGARINRKYNQVVLDKFALYPMSERLADSINEAGSQSGSNLNLLYGKMRNQNVDYMVFAKSRKVGVQSKHKNYNADGTLNTDPYNENELVRIPYGIMGIQADVPSDDSYRVTRGSQITKLVTMDLMDAGMPIDFEVGKPFDQRYSKWSKMSEADKRATSELYKEIKTNQDLLEAKIEVGYRRLLSRLGIRETFNRGRGKREYTIVDRSIAAQALREEILKREVSDNIAQALDSFMEGNSILEATPAYHQIRNILYSIADKEVVSPMMHGGMKVQISSALMENLRIETKDINGKQAYVSDILGFYKKDRKQVCEIMVSRWFKSHLSDQELLDYLNNTDEGRKVLSGIGFRIPTQKQNSIESFVIKRFLPEEFGDAVVVPSAIVKKTGSDFDIDKLTIYLKNVMMVKGLPRVIELKDDTNSTLDERYSEYVLENVGKDTKKYLKFLSRDSVKEMRERHKEERAKLNEKYNIQFEALKERQYEDLPSSYDNIVGEIGSQDDYIAMLFQDGRDVFRLLSPEIKSEFHMVANYILDRNIQGPQEIMEYMVLAQDMIDNQDFDESMTNRLRHLVFIYQQELEALGATREMVNKLWEEVKSKSAEERQGVYDKFLSEKRQHDMDYINRLSEIEELMTIQEFAQLPMLQQNSTRALENAYIESMQRIVSHPLYYDRLIEPNSAEELQELSRKIAKLTVGQTFDYKNVGNILNRRFMSSLRHAFVTGKYAIGISAVNQTNNALNQRQLLYIDPERKKLASEKDKHWLGDVKIRFREFNKVNVEGKGDLATLSMAKNARGQYISDIISQFIDGYVDISNGPWIIELGATPNVVSTWFFLIKVGVPIETVGYFMNQPIIRDYLRAIENSGYTWLFIDSIYNDVRAQYNNSNTGTKVEGRLLPSESELLSMIQAEGLSDVQKDQQQFILEEFMKYATMAQHMFYVTQGSNFDTANLNDPYLIFKKFKQLERAEKSVINDVNSLLENSFIGKLSEIMPRLRNGIAEILISDNQKVREIIEKVLEPYINMNDDDFVKIARKAVSDIFDYAVHMDKDFTRYIINIMVKDGGVAREADKFMEDVANNPMHPLYYNHIVGKDGILRPLYSRRASNEGVNNVKVKGLQNKTYDQNMIIYGFREMRDHLASDPNNKNLYKRLILLGILQSGLSTSSISFTSVIPFEDFVNIYQDAIAKIHTSKSLQQFLDNDVFARNNWNNDDIIPNVRARYTKTMKYNPSMNMLPNQVKEAVKKGEIPPVVSVWDASSASEYEFITYTWEKMNELLPSDWRTKYKGMRDYEAVKQIKAEMRKAGDYSYINKGLFKKVFDDAKGEYLTTESMNQKTGQVSHYYIYKAVNAWGDGPRANEFYDHPRQSVIDNGLIKVNEVDNSKIVGIFTNKKVSSSSNLKYDNMPEFNKLPTRSINPSFTYAGVGSRNTPDEIKEQMTQLAQELERKGFTLNTGDAIGADSAFSKGAKKKNIFKASDANERTRTIAREIHPNPNSLTGVALNLMARNTNQVFGKNLDKPVDFAIVWTPLTKQGIAPTHADERVYYGKNDANNTGGTGQAIALASLKGIPVINMANPEWRVELDIVLEEIDNRPPPPRNGPPGFPETKRPDKHC